MCIYDFFQLVRQLNAAAASSSSMVTISSSGGGGGGGGTLLSIGGETEQELVAECDQVWPPLSPSSYSSTVKPAIVDTLK